MDQTNQNQDQDGNQNGSGDKGPQYVPKEDFDKLHQQFSEFTELATSFFTKGDSMKEPMQNNTQPPANNAGSVGESDFGFTDAEAAEHGFDDKQVKFIQKLLVKNADVVASKAVDRVMSQGTEAEIKRKTVELDNQSFADFPDLKDKNSEFYKETVRIMNEQRQWDRHAESRPDFQYAAALKAERLLRQRNAEKNNSNPNPLPNRFDNFSVEVNTHSHEVNRQERNKNISPERQQLRSLLRG